MTKKTEREEREVYLDERALVPAPVPPIVKPAVSIEEAVMALKEYEALKAAIATPNDIQEITQDGSVRRFYKKSYWRRIATFFNLSVEEVPESAHLKTIMVRDEPVLVASVRYRAQAPNGRATTGDGHCGSDEKGKSKASVMALLGIAHTRAYNRAVSNLVGGGEVSAEEVDHQPWEQDRKPAAAAPQQAAPASGGTDDRVVPFGKNKGRKLSELSDNDLDWLMNVYEERLQDPSKKRFRDDIQRWIDAIRGEMAVRSGQTANGPVAPPGDYVLPTDPPMGDFQEWMALAAATRDVVGDYLYYEVLREHGHKHANEVRDKHSWKKVYRDWYLKHMSEQMFGGDKDLPI